MFGELLKRLTAPSPEAIVDDDARLALGALLVRIARSAIVNTIMERFVSGIVLEIAPPGTDGAVFRVCSKCCV